MVATDPARVDTESRPPLHIVGGDETEAGPVRAARAAPARAGQGRSPAAGAGARGASGPDRISVLLFSLAAVLVVLTLLTKQLIADTPAPAAHHQIIVRKIYRTTIIETVPGPGAGTSVSQSVSSAGSSYAAAPAATTRSSSAP